MKDRTIANSKILETKRLLLRPWEERDAEALFRYAKDPDIGPAAGWKPHENVEESLKIIRTVLATSYAVVLKETMEPIGSIGFMIGSESSLALPDTEAEIGFWVAKPYWGRRLIPEACVEVLRYGFKEIGMRRLWCCYFEGNAKSRRTQEKCGFKYRFTEDDRFYPEMNERRTENVSRITATEWERLSSRDGLFPGGKTTPELLDRLQPINLCDAPSREERFCLRRKDDGDVVIAKGDVSMSWDFGQASGRLRKENLNKELLVKAAKIKDFDNALVWDATAGLGEDALLLAAAGARVKLFEYDPVISAMLKRACEKAKESDELKEIAERMEIAVADSVVAMNEAGRGDEKPDIVYLDPMFPERRKTGLVKKKFQLLKELEDPCDNEEELLDAAIKSGAKKIIIKRPIKAPYLAGRRPNHSVAGDIIRFDCILP